ncbi:MAG: DNA repair protein RecN [Bacteroidaceae bacterium]|nr:DNA repair protein RecN [Bacteroidaceae bacterium]
MLTHLTISNYALIEKLDIDLSSGFSVITGETGAGKSIILGALGLICGQRADAKALKVGATKCLIEATFDVSGLHLEAFFADNDIDFDGVECIVRREINATGKSRAFLNDTPVQLTLLKELSAYIIDIHSQHRNLLMGREDFLLSVLDALADNQNFRKQYAELFATYTIAERELQELREQVAKDQTDTEYMQFQLQQLEEANLKEGEQEELEQEQELLEHAEEIRQSLQGAYNMLNSEEFSVTQQLRQAINNLRQVEEVMPAVSEWTERLESCRIELDDLEQDIEQAAERTEGDPQRLAYLDERLSILYGLQKKHRKTSVEELIELRNSLAEQLDRIENSDEYLAKKTLEVEQLRKSLCTTGTALTKTRKTAAASLATGLSERLQLLGMPAVQVEVRISDRPAPCSSGMDAATFLFSANKNVPMQDVSQIASGGEIARLMLSLKAILSAHQSLPTIIFDEIDTGVSGKMAERMAEVMQAMAASCQVICITHLPQIAALGLAHYFVYKTEHDDATTSTLKQLTPDERIREIATMLSGAELTAAAMENAKALLRLQ